MAHAPVPFFYELQEYAPLVNREIPRDVNHSYLHFSESSRALCENLMQRYCDIKSIERVGVLKGDYVMLDGLMLIARDGRVIKANMAQEEPGISRLADNYCRTAEFAALKQEVLAKWDQFTAVHNLPVIAHMYANNYFHYTLETISKLRFFIDHPQMRFVIPEKFHRKHFQKDLLARTVGAKIPLIQKSLALRVSDPLLGYEFMSQEGLQWVRKTVNLTVLPGPRKIYLRRLPGGTRFTAGGGISETPEFLAFLKKHRFETVDFGNGELGIEEQVMRLEGVGVILAPHGATLTNMIYVEPPLSVIEVMGVKTAVANYAHLCSMLTFNYFGLFRSTYDADWNMIVDVDELSRIMEKL